MEDEYFQSGRYLELQERYRLLKEELADVGWLTDGSVSPNQPGHWRWTTKVKAKTVAVALSAEQAELFKVAIMNHRKLETILREMRKISREVLLNSAPGVRSRKRSS